MGSQVVIRHIHPWRLIAFILTFMLTSIVGFALAANDVTQLESTSFINAS